MSTLGSWGGIGGGVHPDAVFATPALASNRVAPVLNNRLRLDKLDIQRSCDGQSFAALNGS
ncbi:hypothetical protein GCM10009087_14630 [Sphingomonas oligophenolica]